MISYLYGNLQIYKERYPYDLYSVNENLINQSVTFAYPCLSASSCYPIEGEILPGLYSLEVWGAQGGACSTTEGGRGGYTNASIKILNKINVSLYIGGVGGSYSTSVDGGFNGGGNGSRPNHFEDRPSGGGGGGGGGTDIRLDSSLTSRTIVAGGGGGSRVSLLIHISLHG